MILALSRKMMDLLTITLRSHLMDNKYMNKQKEFQQYGMRVIDSFALFSLTAAETTPNTSLNLMTSPYTITTLFFYARITLRSQGQPDS